MSGRIAVRRFSTNCALHGVGRIVRGFSAFVHQPTPTFGQVVSPAWDPGRMKTPISRKCGRRFTYPLATANPHRAGGGQGGALRDSSGINDIEILVGYGQQVACRQYPGRIGRAAKSR